MKDIAIDLIEISKNFSTFEGTQTVLQNVSLCVHQGEGTVLAKVMVCYDAAASAINALAEFESESNVDFSSKIKYPHLQVTHEYAKLIESLSSTS